MTLHDLIEDMGKEIVRRESPKEPGERSRLWSHEDINQVLQENKVSKIDLVFIFKSGLSLLIITHAFVTSIFCFIICTFF